MKKRLTAMLLVVCMLFTFMPTAVFAVDGDPVDPLTVSASNNAVEIVKSASRTETPGVYDVTVSINPKVDLTPKPTEIVLVLDISYSMQYCMEEKHEHTASCVSCGQEEHTHGWGCYDWHDNLICGKTEHSHTEACYICGKTEHTHGWGCYDWHGNLTCGKTEHSHTKACYICGKTEHEHYFDEWSYGCGGTGEGSRIYQAGTKMKELYNSLKDLPNTTIYGVKFAGSAYSLDTSGMPDNIPTSPYDCESDTNYKAALTAVHNAFQYDDSNKIVVMLSDGEPKSQNYDTILSTVKGEATIYTVAFPEKVQALTNVATKSSYAYEASNADQLKQVLTTIAQNIRSAAMTDDLGNEVTIVRGSLSSNADYEDGEVTWAPEGTVSAGDVQKITYQVKLKDSAEGNVALNGDITLEYIANGSSGTLTLTDHPTDVVKRSDLIVKYYVDGVEVDSNTVSSGNLVWEDNTYADWNTISTPDSTYTYKGDTKFLSEATYNGSETKPAAAPAVSADDYIVAFRYVSENLNVDKTLTSVERGGERLPSVPDEVKVGDVLTWTVTVTNNGTLTVSGISVSDKLNGTIDLTLTPKTAGVNPANFDLAAGASECFTATYTVADADAGTTLSNVAVAGKDTESDDKNEVEVEDIYGVSYEFVSGTSGKALPSGLPALPSDSNEYATGVSVANKGASSYTAIDVTEKNADDSTYKVGVWEFTGWDAASKPMVEGGITFTGTWTYSDVPKSTGKVSYEFVSGTAGKSLPAGVTAQLGSTEDAETYYVGQTVVNSKAGAAYTTVDVLVDGVKVGEWKFEGWTPASQKMDADGVTFTGTWKYYVTSYEVNILAKTDGGATLETKTITLDQAVGFTAASSESVTAITATGGAITVPQKYTGSDGKNYTLDSLTKTPADGKYNAAVSSYTVVAIYSLDEWKDDPAGDSETGGDKIPDKYQAKIVYQPDAASKGSVTPTLDIVTLKNGRDYATSAQVTAASTASAATSYKFTSWTSDISGLDLTAQDATLSQPFTAAGNGVYTFTANFELDVAPLTVNYITDEDPAQTLKTADSKNVTIGNGYKIAEPGDTTGTPDYTIVEKLTDVTGHKFAYDPIATGVSNLSGTMTASGKTVNVIYSADNNDDGIPDKYQATVTFKVVNGAWNDKTPANVVRTVTLTDAEGKWAADGTYTLTASDIPAAGSEPNTGYKAGDWEAPKPEAGKTKITQDAEFTYKYVIILCNYRIDLHYVARDGSDSEVEGKETSADYGTAITALLPSGYTSAQTYGGESYLYDTYTVSGDATKLTDAQNPTVIDIYYDIDAIGTVDPDEGDDVPDKNQLIFTFVSADTNTGEVSGAVKQVVTKGTDGKANPASVATATAKTNYAFAYWSTGDKKDYTIGMTDLKDDGYAVDTTFTATFLADNKGGGTEGETPDGTPDAYQIFIKYVSKDTKAGTVSPTFETINLTRDSNQELIVKNVALRSGSLAVVTDANVYSFDRWELAGEKVGSNAALTYTFDEVVPASTYTFYAFFAKEASEMELNAAYKVEHYKENADGTYTLAESDFPLYDKIGATVKAVAKDYDGYTVDLQAEGTVASGEVIKPELNPDGTGVKILVLKLYYAVDNWNENNNQETGGDDIPDKYQVLVKYTSERGGEITGLEKEVITLKDANGKYLTQGDVEASGSEVERTSSKYRFDEWTGDWTNKSLGDDEELEPFTIKDAKGGETYIVTAEFNKKSSGETIKEPEVPQGLNGDDHFQYIFGYDDGTVRPLAKITRAEVAAIFYRLLDDETREYYFTTENDFPDMKDTMWYNKAVSTLANAGIITGCSDGLFHGGRNITRAELATIIAKFDNITYRGKDLFSDISGHWARAYINSSADKGWIVGDGTGKFRPYDDITRAEVMTMINAVLNRAVDEDGLCAGYKKWPDNTKGTWYYYQVIEATNYHDYEREADMTETWLEILPDKIWDEAGR